MKRGVKQLLGPSSRAAWALPSPFGLVLVECSAQGVARITFAGDSSALEGSSDSEAERRQFAAQNSWVREAVAEVKAYLTGAVVTFQDVPLDLTGQSPFRRRALEACRQIPYGQTISYTELAARAGNPAAVRAAGSAMSHNPVPLLIPCHRVLRNDGGLGGYGGPGGTQLKRLLLEMERHASSRRS
jgi:methylated-DNA-[protein]-cysteine S-methyltransferase